MTVLKSPLLSLNARGSIGDSITFTKRRGVNIAEKKPVLPYFLTLPVQYQRWLYQDYAYLWTQQSDATKATYKAAGRLRNLSGFQFWMKYNLTHLPDIAAYWKLDEISGSVVYDSGRNGNDLVNIGATPVAGTIAGAYYFDGVNDELTRWPSASMINFTAKTVEFFITPTAFDGSHQGIYDGGRFTLPGGDLLMTRDNSNRFYWYWSNTIGAAGGYDWAYTPLKRIHVASTWDGSNIQVYSEGVPEGAPSAFTGIMGCSGATFKIGNRETPFFGHHTLDNFIIYNRALDAAEILRHSERSWTL